MITHRQLFATSDLGRDIKQSTRLILNSMTTRVIALDVIGRSSLKPLAQALRPRVLQTKLLLVRITSRVSLMRLQNQLRKQLRWIYLFVVLISIHASAIFPSSVNRILI